MRFANPQILGLLVPVLLALAGFLLWAWRRKQRLITHFVQDRLLAQLTVGVSKPRQKLQLVLLGVAVACAGIALARPQWGFAWEEARQRGLDIVVAVDTSRSMHADDMRPNRLERAKLSALDVMRLARSDRLALVPFAGTAFLQCPLTLDQEAFRQNVQALDVGIMPQGGTALVEAIKVARDAFKDSGDNTKVLILMTDGEDHEAGTVEAAREAWEEGIRIFTLGVGTSEGEVLRELDGQGNMVYIRDGQGEVVQSRLNQGLLQEVAAAAGGFYLPLQASEAVETLYEKGLSGLVKSELASRLYRRYHERFHWPLGLAMVLLVTETLLADRFRQQRRSMPVATPPAGAGAAGVAVSLFLAAGLQAASPGRAEQDYLAGDYDQARQAYERLLERSPDDPRLLYNAGTAAYQARNYTNAIAVLEKATRAPDLELQQRAFYNLGDALYRRGEQVPDRQSREDLWRQAVQNFDAALKLNPQDPDAEFNRRFVEQRIEELKQQEPPPPDSEPSDQSEESDESKQSQQPGQSEQPEESERPDSPPPSEQSQQTDSPRQSEQPEPSDSSEQQQSSEQPEEGESSGQPEPSGQPGPAEPEQGEPVPQEQPPRGEMTPQEAEQMLDAAKQEERPLIFKPEGRERRRPNRVFKDW